MTESPNKRKQECRGFSSKLVGLSEDVSIHALPKAGLNRVEEEEATIRKQQAN